MYKLKRNICIEDYKARLGTKVPTCENGAPIYEDFQSYNDWNRIPYDIVIDGESSYSELIDIADIFPLSTIITESGVTEYIVINNEGMAKKVTDSNSGFKRYVMKYKTMSDRYSLLKKIMREARYYRPCLIRGEYKWVEISDSVWKAEFGVVIDNKDGTENSNINSDKFFAQRLCDDGIYNWIMSNELPPIDENETRYCCVWDKMDVFFEYFRVENNNKRYEKIFFSFVNGLYTDNVRGMQFVQQYISLPICMTENIALFSTYTPYIQEWTPKKRFYLGDHVHYVMDSTLDPNGNVYKLTDSSLNTEWIDVPKSIYDAYTSYSGRYRLHDGRYQISVKYYKGYFDDKTKLTYFDELDTNGKILTYPNGNTKHWKLCTTSDITPEHDIISAITESSLTFLQRKKRSFDDDGNELPFIIDDLNTTNSELNYLLGVHNTETNGAYSVCDVLQKVNFYSASSSASTCSYEYLDNDTVVPIKAIDDNRPLNCEYIGFEYYNDCRFKDGSPDITTGIIHKEIYHFTLDAMCAKVKESNGTYIWVVTGATENETVEKLPEPFATLYGKTYKFEYQGLSEYREMGVVVQVINDASPTYADPSIGDMAICTGGQNTLYIYSDISVNNTVEYDWIPKECANGDAYHLIDKNNGTYGDMFMYDHGSWINMTDSYGISKEKMAYNPETNEYEMLRNGTCYTLETQFAYINIDYSTTYHWDNERGEYLKDLAVLSSIYINGDNTLHDEFQDVPIFYDEGNGSTVNVSGEDSCDIERGTSAAYERHWILGEINTYQDLLEYKNNLFSL